MPSSSHWRRIPTPTANLAWCVSTFRRPWQCCSSSSPTGRCSAVNGTAFAVTPTLRESYAEGDDDELADVAHARSGAGVGAPAGRGRRRAVVGASAAARGAGGRGRRRDAPGPTSTTLWCGLTGPVGIDDVIAAYVDNAAAEPAVLAAIDAGRRCRSGGRGRRTHRRRRAGPRPGVVRAPRSCRSCSNCSDGRRPELVVRDR